MTKRLQTIFDLIPVCDSFADVGCDHGLIAKQVADSGKCSKITISDISAKSLEKAKNLLRAEMLEGKVSAVVCDGLDGIPNDTQTVLIAGMGGEEIVKILSKAAFTPRYLILQPMKNADKVRSLIIGMGYSIKRDFIFYDEKYYFLIFAELNGSPSQYTADEIAFGWDNLHEPSEDFIKYITYLINKTKEFADNVVSQNDIENINSQLLKLNGILNEILTNKQCR